MATTAARKADNLHRRLVKGFGQHDFSLVIMTWVDGEDIVIRVKADHAPALNVHRFINAGIHGRDIYRIAAASIDKELGAEVDRRIAQAAWEVAAARASRPQPILHWPTRVNTGNLPFPTSCGVDGPSTVVWRQVTCPECILLAMPANK